MRSSDADPAVVIVDPCIREMFGHYVTYASACRDALATLGLRTSCWAHRAVTPSVTLALDARPTFAHDCWHEFNRIPKLRFLVDPPLAARAFLRDARAAARTLSTEPVLFAPTVDHRQLLAWARWLRSARGPRRAVLMLRYSFANPSGEGWVRAATWVRLALRILNDAPDDRVRLISDSARLAEEYVALGARHVDVVPIPHTTVVRGRRRTPGTPARLVMLGDARTEKGFAVLGDAISRLRAQGRATEAEFVIQANIQEPAYSELKRVRERMRTLPGVTLVERALSSTEYDSLLASSDLVLLPYDRGVYRARTSGPFAEALAAGIPVVCSSDTWMSDQLATYGGGEQCRSGDPSSLADAIERAVQRLPALTAQARGARDAWVDFHSPAGFANVMRRLVI
jgi:glycosyltransferase involved in cell wall biosynthesis